MLATKKIINRDDYNSIVFFLHFLSERIMSSNELCMAVYVLKKKISDINFVTRDICKMNETGKIIKVER